MAHRVPRGIIPSNYQIEISPDLGNRTFEGFVVVATDVVEPTTKLVCNCADLLIIEVLVDGQAATYSLNPNDETLVVAKRTVTRPSGLVVRSSSAPLLIANSPSSTMSVMSNDAFRSGSSQQGKARRASVD